MPTGMAFARRPRPARCRAPPHARPTHITPLAFADRLAALVNERRSQVCLGLDPDPSGLEPRSRPPSASPAEAAAEAVAEDCIELIGAAGPACVAVKPQLACFERLGWAGWRALERVIEAAHAADLLVVADGKRGDVPVSAAVYGDALFGSTTTPWGEVDGLGADAATVNPLIGADALEPLIAAAVNARAGLFALVRTSNPGAADVLDLATTEGPVSEHLARMVAAAADRLVGESGLSGMGAVVGATEPGHLGRLRELMPNSIFLVPGIGAQGGSAADLGPAFSGHPASVLVPASRSISGAADPGAAAAELRDALWAVSQSVAR